MIKDPTRTVSANYCCGTAASHRVGAIVTCCRCYVRAGNPPADWHPACMKEATLRGYYNVKGPEGPHR